MTKERLWHTLRIMLIRSAVGRADYCRKHKLFHHVGERVLIQSRNLPLYSELISLHNNVRLASRVHFITHDVVHMMLNDPSFGGKEKFRERVGCIEIMDNVFIGAGTTIMYNVRIGSNVIVGAESVVTKDLEPTAVYAGAPARKICSMEEFLEKQRKMKGYPAQLYPRGQKVSKELTDFMWEQFEVERKNNYKYR